LRRRSGNKGRLDISNVLITGSADGLGLMAARLLIDEGHAVTLHARSDARAQEALASAPGAAGALAGDLASIRQTRELADRANAIGPFDAIIHNAGIGYRERRRIQTEDGLAQLFQINVLAPYLLTALISPPQRLVYLSSGLHRSGNPDLDDLQWQHRAWDGLQAYSDSKLFDVVLAFAVARLRPATRSNALEPGWVATKMGGPGAPDDLDQGAETQVWLAVSDDPQVDVSGRYFYHRRLRDSHPAASDAEVQDGLLRACQQITDTALPAH
jgi:NAD(P)-dependent dehydrogenase (short-subunit alcohol dehydrogenase family)